jgi:hypothetical protein
MKRVRLCQLCGLPGKADFTAFQPVDDRSQGDDTVLVLVGEHDGDSTLGDPSDTR